MQVIILILLSILYLLPSLLAIGKKYSTGIVILNIALGWTFIGYIVAIIWAVSSPKRI